MRAEMLVSVWLYVYDALCVTRSRRLERGAWNRPDRALFVKARRFSLRFAG